MLSFTGNVLSITLTNRRIPLTPFNRFKRELRFLTKPAVLRSKKLSVSSSNGRVVEITKEVKLEILKKQVKSLKDALAIIEVAIKDAESCLEELSIDETSPAVTPMKPDPVSGKAIVCLGKDCKKQGSLETFKHLGQELSDRPELKGVKLQTSKCLKECGKGPVVATKFGKKKMKLHKKVKPRQIGQLISKDLEGI